MTDINLINQNQLKMFIRLEVANEMGIVSGDIKLLFDRLNALDDRVAIIESKGKGIGVVE